MKKKLALSLLFSMGALFAMERDQAALNDAFFNWAAAMEDGGRVREYPDTCYRPDNVGSARGRQSSVAEVRRGRELNDGQVDAGAHAAYGDVAAQLGAGRRHANGDGASAQVVHQPPRLDQPRPARRLLTKFIILGGVGAMIYLVYQQFFAQQKEEPVSEY